MRCEVSGKNANDKKVATLPPSMHRIIAHGLAYCCYENLNPVFDMFPTLLF